MVKGLQAAVPFWELVGELLVRALGRVLFEDFEGNDVQGARFGGLEPYGRGHAVLVSLQPSWCTDAPVVTGLQSGKAIGRGWGTEVVPLGLAVAKEGFVHNTTNAVAAMVRRVGAAMAITEPAGHWLTAADFQSRTQHVEGCFRNAGWHQSEVYGQNPSVAPRFGF